MFLKIFVCLLIFLLPNFLLEGSDEEDYKSLIPKSGLLKKNFSTKGNKKSKDKQILESALGDGVSEDPENINMRRKKLLKQLYKESTSKPINSTSQNRRQGKGKKASKNLLSNNPQNTDHISNATKEEFAFPILFQETDYVD
ncbi:hypothetical protein ACQ4LE_001272 [Meloidogyne hapla]